MRTDGGGKRGEERPFPNLCCCGRGDDSNRNHTEPRVRQTWLEFWLSSFVLVRRTKPLEPTYPFLHCLFYCLCFLLGSGGNVALTFHAKLDLEGRTLVWEAGVQD